jgi:transposase
MKATVSNAENASDITQQLATENTELKQQIQTLQQQLDWFKRQLFGRKSEKRLAQSADQLDIGLLFDQPAKDQPAAATEQITYTRKKQRQNSCVTDQGLRFDDSVPVEVIELPAPELKGPDADQYEIIDEKVTRRLAQRPGSYVVLEYHRPVVKHKPSQTLSSVPAPTAIFDKSLADVSLLAGLLTDKFLYHLPLYRQHQRMKDAGITLSRATLTYYVQRTIDLLSPIYQAQWRHVLLSRVLAMDETPVKAGRQRKGKMKSTWYWPIYGEEDEVCFTWSQSRGAAHVQAQLGDFKGVLLSDGYAAYDRYAKNKPAVTQAQCWTHTRRYFERAKDSDPAAHEALEQIGALYTIESQIKEKGLPGEEKQAWRTKHAKPKVDDFFHWCREQRQRMDLVNTDLLSKALVYAENHQAQLNVYLSDPDVPIDTNHLERTLRVIPMGRKNWLFNWTEVGAQQVGIIQSLLVTCRLHDIDPYTYLVDVLQRVSMHPAKDVEELTPRRWKEKFAANPLKSDLDRLGQ